MRILEIAWHFLDIRITELSRNQERNQFWKPETLNSEEDRNELNPTIGSSKGGRNATNGVLSVHFRLQQFLAMQKLMSKLRRRYAACTLRYARILGISECSRPKLASAVCYPSRQKEFKLMAVDF